MCTILTKSTEMNITKIHLFAPFMALFMVQFAPKRIPPNPQAKFCNMHEHKKSLKTPSACEILYTSNCTKCLSYFQTIVSREYVDKD